MVKGKNWLWTHFYYVMEMFFIIKRIQFIRASFGGWFWYPRQPTSNDWDLPTTSNCQLLYPWPPRAKVWAHHLSPSWGKTGGLWRCVWRIWYLCHLHPVGCRWHYLDSSIHHEVPCQCTCTSSFQHISSSHWCSVARFGHTAWTPPTLPNSIVLLGGYRETPAEFTAENVPGNNHFRS